MERRDAVQVQQGSVEADPAVSVVILKDGPYLIRGAPPLHTQTIERNEQGQSWQFRQGRQFAVKDGTRLCRCGHSQNKPYCDGSHARADVDLTETATFEPMLDSAQEIDGPRYALTDNERYCAFARFCDNGEGIWNEVRQPGEQHARLTMYMAHHCPSGRLLVWDRATGELAEEPSPGSLSLIEDPGAGASGPLVLRGGIRVESASGESYEIRNRQTLCRCGASSNKPFCDGSHATIRFQDGL